MDGFSRYGSFKSKYYYKNTDVLINKLGIKDNLLLQEADVALSYQRLLELQLTPLLGNFDSQHLMDIHKYIFGDIYYFAGVFRDEDISKGDTLFAKSVYLTDNAKILFNDLGKENFLFELDQQKLCDRIAYYMSELNILHPFREGNGRAIREFIRCLVLNCGYEINWHRVPPKELLNASIKSVYDIEPLARCIQKAIMPITR